MRLTGFTCLITFFLVCLFFILIQKSPFVAIGVVAVLVGFKFTKTSINPLFRVIHELHTLNLNLAAIATIADSMENITTQTQVDAEKDTERATPTEAHRHSDVFP